MISAVNEFMDDLRGGKMEQAPIVTVAQGQLQGRVVTGATGKAYYSFQGIPYAKPPLGSLRFKAPQPPESWDGVRDATTEGNVSAQIDPLIQKQYMGDENCLFLNVYTPNLDGEFLPVMVFIHGGGFRFGSGSSSMYGPDYLLNKDVILVTINYRCGALGFLSLNTPEVPGNAGLKDIIQAVRWVKDNIHNFGGNSGNITVFGESCGGVAVSLLTASPMSRNLINKAVIQSGIGLNSWGFQKNALENARTLAKHLGCESEDVDEILDFLTATPVREIVEANEKMHTPEVFITKASNIFAPVVEKEFPGVEAALTESFIELLITGRVAEIPIMIGSTTLEFTFEKTTDDLQSFIPEDLKIERNSPESLEIAEEIKRLYFKGSHTGVESLNEYFSLQSDKLVNIDTHRYVQYLVKVSNKPIYYYKFDYVGELNLSKKLLSSLGLKHAGHMDELGYLFKNDLQDDVDPTAEDLRMREIMTKLWTNFAKCGNPTPEENHYLTVTWLPVTSENLYYMNLGSELSLGTNPDADKMEFWDRLYGKYFKIWEHDKVNTTEEPQRKEKTASEPVMLVQETVTTVIDHGDKQPEVIVEETVYVASKEELRTPPSSPAEPAQEQEIEQPQSLNVAPEPVNVAPEPVNEAPEPVNVAPEPVNVAPEPVNEASEPVNVAPEPVNKEPAKYMNGNGNAFDRKPRTSNEIKMVQNANGGPKDVIRANDPPEDDLPKNIGVNKFVNFFESLGGKK